MIQKVGQIMIYVDDQDECVRFWKDIMGFRVVDDQDNGEGMRWIEMSPRTESVTTIVLHNKAFVAKMEPDMNLGTPSLMFFTDNVEQLHEHLSKHDITIGEIINMPNGPVFNFADFEGNYFAVMERK
ncbi:VOC family protein [Salirhabdus sp. Marseille-P4669]|uniref:VOC family protein n=1 Tax=Salirhabdus sp. Marseille-P4669 TaxID=2042310 RepID=UPI000C7CFB82|nr:VOC family protein [Salirhabdus sp. Marseille-P4669]